MTEEEKKAIERAKRELQKTTFLTDIAHKDLKTILNLIQKQQKENEEKDKMIDLMAKDLLTCGFDWIDFGKATGDFNKDKEKLKQYFKKQTKEV